VGKGKGCQTSALGAGENVDRVRDWGGRVGVLFWQIQLSAQAKWTPVVERGPHKPN
jgi:hypothetical protein